MPVTFTFDLSDANFPKDVQTFARYFNFVEYSSLMISNNVYQSHTDIEMESLIKAAEKSMIEELQKGIKSTKNSVKRPSVIGQENGAKSMLNSSQVIPNSQKNQPKFPQAKENIDDKKISDWQVLVEEKEVVTEITETVKTESLVNDFGRLSVSKKSSENPALKEYRRIIDRLKTFDFKIDLYNLPLIKNKNDEASKINYGLVRIDDCGSIGKNIWILKVAGMNRGFGIEIFSSLDKFKTIIKDISTGYQETIIQNNKKTSRSKGYIKTTKFVIQKYIEKPLLFKNRKFDLRVWVLVTSDMKPYIFRECYVRLSTEAYKLDNFNEKFVHLTNNALQKYSDNYSEDETLKSTKELEDYVRESRKNDFSFKIEIWEKIKEIIRHVYKCSEKTINPNNKNKSFEIFGYDFMIDYDLKVWLIEVNTNPSISMGGKILDAYVPRMINDTFKLTIDKIFPQPASSRKSQTDNGLQAQIPANRIPEYRMDNYPDEENLWDLLFD
jgi:hypothetical protein